MSDLSRPNHYFEDSLGDPRTCTGDHNHPEPETDDPRFSGLPASVVETAKQAHCERCKVQITEAPSLVGTIFVSYTIPSLGIRHRTFLCGDCGLAFREFLNPELVDFAPFQALKGMIQEKWDRS